MESESTTHSQAEAHVGILRILCEGAGISFSETRARQALSTAFREFEGDEASWMNELALAGEQLGLRTAIVRAELNSLLDRDGMMGPMVGKDADNQPVIVAATKANRVCLLGLDGVTRRWLKLVEAREIFGVRETGERLSWLVAHAALPFTDQDASRHLNLPHAGGVHHHHHQPPLRRLLRLFKPEVPDIILVSIFSLVVGILMLATPIAVQALVNNIAFGVVLTPIVVLSLLLFACLTIAAVLRSLQTWTVEILQQRIFARVVADLAYRLPRVRYDSFDREHGPELVNRFFDVLTVQKVSASLLLDGLAIVLQGGIGLAILAFYHPFLLGFDLILLMAIALLVWLLGSGAVETSIRESIAKYKVAGWLEEMARHPLSFKLSGGQHFALERADLLTEQYLAARKDHFRVLFRQIVFALFLQALASTALLGLGGWLVINGQLTIGQLVAAELIVTTIVGSVAKLGKHMESYYDLMAAVDKLGHLIDLPMERLDGSYRAPDEPVPARLSLVDVDFSYEGGEPIFSGFQLDVAAGERVGIVGPNGCGKTTLVDLIFALRTPSRGRIELDGVDLRELRLSDLRDQIAAVKGCEVLDATVAENVRMGRESVTPSDVRWALRQAGLLEDVLQLPEGIQTRLLTGGPPLSNGQARRLALARAIASRPRLLVVDETIDGLDDEVRENVLEALFSQTAPWTLIVVSHDERLLQHCNRVINLKAAS